MKKKIVTRPRFWIIAVVLILLILLVRMIIVNLPVAQLVSDFNFDLTVLDDGTYRGECDNGLVFVEVGVEVENHMITAVQLLKHQNGRGQKAEKIVDDVVTAQSIEVDAVSGATASSQTILKAIENALENKTR